MVPKVMIWGDVFAPVLASDVFDDLTASPLAEVDIDVRERDALGIEEPLEDQTEFKGVDVGDLQAVRHETPGG